MTPPSRAARGLGPLWALLLVVAFFAVADALQERSAGFATERNLRVVLAQSATVAVAALGMTLVILIGGIDLSAGTAMALAATALAWLLRAGYPVTAAIAGCVLAGGLCGFLNGLLIGLGRMLPFIVTLGSMTAYLGLAKLAAGETTIRPSSDQVPGWLGALVSTSGEHQLLGLPAGVWLGLLLALPAAAALRCSAFGRRMVALGSNENAARLSGIDVAWTKVAVYTLGGLFVGVAGIYQFARLSVGNPTSGLGQELRIIAAVVVGGGSLSGGRASVAGTLAGAALMGVVASGCSALRLSNPLQDILIGLIVITAVLVDRLRSRA